MQNFELELSEKINIFSDSGITPNELFILQLLLPAIEGNSEYLTQYFSKVSEGKKLFKECLISLFDKKIINNTYKFPKEGEVLDIGSIPFNKNFLKKYYKDTNQAGKEFFDAYPSFINIGGKMCSIKNFTKAGLFTFEDFCRYYSKAIKNSKVSHDRIMEALEFAKENNLINYTILEFIASKKYLEIEGIKNGDSDINGYNNSELL
jgi:hypothetical protein